MSQKALKRKIRRGTEDSDSDFKLPSHYSKKENLSASEEGVKTRQNLNGSGSNNESDSEDNVALKNLINTEDNGKSDSPVNRSRSVTPQNIKPKDATDEQQPEKEGNCSNGNEHGSENGQQDTEPKSDEELKSVEMEPLLLDAEDPELMFPEEESESDLDFSDKGSPVLSRSVTRRSHTRNIPTPKTPKSMNEQNGSETDQVCVKLDKSAVISVERLSDSDVQKLFTETEESSQTSTMDSNSEITIAEDEPAPEIIEQVVEGSKNEADLTVDSCVSALENNESLLVNITGDDETRNIEFSCRDPSIMDESTESQYQNRSLRSVSSRRSIRPNAEDVYRRRAFHNAKEGENRVSMERISVSIKRKQRSTTPDGPKRYKLEPDPEKSPGFLSYISSPIINMKNRFSRTQLPTSTPILKGFKTNPLLATEGASASQEEQNLDGTRVIPEKKWCVIM